MAPPGPFSLLLPRDLLEALLAHARAELPNECCGLLAGPTPQRVAAASHRYPLPNAAADPRRYEADSRALLAAFRDVRERGLELLAVYHSHPTSAPVPSRTDHELWFHGDAVVCLILSLQNDPPALRGWWLRDGLHAEAEILVR